MTTKIGHPLANAMTVKLEAVIHADGHIDMGLDIKKDFDLTSPQREALQKIGRWVRILFEDTNPSTLPDSPRYPPPTEEN